MQVKYVNPFISATANLFRNFIGVSVEPQKPYLKKENHNLEEVSGIIGLAGETVGAIVISLSRDTAIAAVSKMEKAPHRALSKDVIDGVGEMVNIVAGNAKKDLLDFRIEISLPGVITGYEYGVHWPEGIPIVVIPFKSEIGNFSVYVSLRDIA
jgi:chemotaxis protein CheX